MGQRLVAAISVRAQDVFDPYRPELHYMRGPGPRWREKHGVTARNRQSRGVNRLIGRSAPKPRWPFSDDPPGRTDDSASWDVSVVHSAATFIGHGNFRQGRAQPDL